MIQKSYKRAIDGGIIQIPLWDNFGFCYAKHIDATKHPELDGLMSVLKVFDLRMSTPIQNLSLLENKEFIHSGILVAGLPPTITKGLWQVIGKDSINEKDLTPLKFKRDKYDSGSWVLTINGKFVDEEVDNLDDLEEYAYNGTGNIEIRLTILFMLKEGIDPRKKLDLNDDRVKWLVEKYATQHRV